MRRYNCITHTDVEDAKVDAFLEAIVAVCNQHNMSLGHEDRGGAFEVYEGYDEEVADWLREAHIDSW